MCVCAGQWWRSMQVKAVLKTASSEIFTTFNGRRHSLTETSHATNIFRDFICTTQHMCHWKTARNCTIAYCQWEIIVYFLLLYHHCMSCPESLAWISYCRRGRSGQVWYRGWEVPQVLFWVLPKKHSKARPTHKRCCTSTTRVIRHWYVTELMNSNYTRYHIEDKL